MTRERFGPEHGVVEGLDSLAHRVSRQGKGVADAGVPEEPGQLHRPLVEEQAQQVLTGGFQSPGWRDFRELAGRIVARRPHGRFNYFQDTTGTLSGLPV